ncbi:MAG: nitroreductase family protein [Pseudomonadota bacterium]
MNDTLAALIEQRFGLPTDVGAERPATGTVAEILNRRTHRRYRDQPVDDDLLNVLLACGLSASAKSDLQQASVVVVRDGAKRKAIADLIPSMPWIANAPVFLVFCGDNLRIRTASKMRDKPFPNDTVDMFMNCAIDAGLVMQTFILAAESEGLGCCPISEIRTHIDTVSALLKLPDYVFPISGLCVGYPAREGFSSMRLPLSLTLHVDEYDATNLEQQLDDYDRRRDARHSTPADSYREVERFGHPNFYGWSEDKTRQYSVPHRHGFLRYLRDRGFAME